MSRVKCGTDVAVTEQPYVHHIDAALVSRIRVVHVHNVQDGRAQASQASRSATVSRRTTTL